MAEYLIQDTTLTAIGDAVRTKTGGTGALSPDGMATALNNIANRDSNNLSVSGATVTVPAGNYKAQATKSVATATQATPSVSIDANGKITASATQSAGYVTAGTKTETKQLTTQATKTVTPTESSQTAVASGVYTTGAVSVSPIPSEYIVREEISEQDTLISNIMTALEGKAAGGSSGGGSVETCEVNCIGANNFYCLHTRFYNNTYSCEYAPVDETMQNVVKGAFAITDEGFTAGNEGSWSITGGTYEGTVNQGSLVIFNLTDDVVTIEYTV